VVELEAGDLPVGGHVLVLLADGLVQYVEFDVVGLLRTVGHVVGHG
jgi:hypothetical protein